jgi:hypothetical protein
MTAIRAAFLLAFAFTVSSLVGCAAPVVRTPELDKAVKSVAVVSLLSEQSRVERIGLTVFNNKSVVVDHGGELNKLAIDTVESSLRKARPEWQLKDARADVQAMLAAKKSVGSSFMTHTSAIQPELAALATRLDVDLMFVVIETALDNTPGQGVGVRLRTMSLSSLKDAVVHSVCLLVLVDRQGNEITNRWGGSGVAIARMPAESLGLDYDLDNLAVPATRARVAGVMRERLQAQLTASATGLGY